MNKGVASWRSEGMPHETDRIRRASICCMCTFRDSEKVYVCALHRRLLRTVLFYLLVFGSPM